MNTVAVDGRSSVVPVIGHRTQIYSGMFFIYFDVFTVHLVEFIIQSNKCTSYIYIYIYIYIEREREAEKKYIYTLRSVIYVLLFEVELNYGRTFAQKKALIK